MKEKKKVRKNLHQITKQAIKMTNNQVWVQENVEDEYQRLKGAPTPFSHSQIDFFLFFICLKLRLCFQL